MIPVGLGRLIDNVRGGLHLAFLRPWTLHRFHVSLEQVVLLILLGLGLQLGWEWILTPAPRELWLDGYAVHSVWLLLTLGLAFVASRESRHPDAMLRLAVLLLAPLFVGWMGFAVLELMTDAFPTLAERLADVYWAHVFAIWLFPVYTHVLRLATGLPWLRAAGLCLVYVLLLGRAFSALPSTYVVFTQASPEPAAPSPVRDRLDAESTLYAQPGRVEGALAALRPQRADVVDLYLVTFGADARQDVFRSEVAYVDELFARRFDTEGRSISLVNHRSTLDQVPIASASNLRAVLHGLGEIMDPSEDLLFLYLTGHGSRQHRLQVRFPDLPLNTIDPATLRTMLESAGIGGRIVAVSSCYSGGYIEPLAAADALVMSASAADRTSFGCSDDADLTYFARAFFERELELGLDFVAAFEGASERLAAIEVEEELTPSRPQIAVGDALHDRLERLRGRLAARLQQVEASPPRGDQTVRSDWPRRSR